MVAAPISISKHSVWSGPPRTDAPELLDMGCGTPGDVAANLSEMGRINHSLGGVHALTRHLYPRLIQTAKAHLPITLLDLGTGSADLPVTIARWARRHRLTLSIVAVDWSARNLAVARRRLSHWPEVQLVQADALRLPLDAASVDFVISTLFVHHFSPSRVIALLQAAFASARYGVIMSDLVRGWLPLIAFQLIQPMFARHWLTRHDGALSIRRAYTPAELAELARAAGLPARVHTHWPWRMTLVAEKETPP